MTSQTTRPAFRKITACPAIAAATPTYMGLRTWR